LSAIRFDLSCKDRGDERDSGDVYRSTESIALFQLHLLTSIMKRKNSLLADLSYLILCVGIRLRQTIKNPLKKRAIKNPHETGGCTTATAEFLVL